MPTIATQLPRGFPPVGSKWKDRDSRRKRTIEVIRHDMENKRIRIHCIETDVLTWAKPSRFTGKDQSYTPLEQK